MGSGQSSENSSNDDINSDSSETYSEDINLDNTDNTMELYNRFELDEKGNITRKNNSLVENEVMPLDNDELQKLDKDIDVFYDGTSDGIDCDENKTDGEKDETDDDEDETNDDEDETDGDEDETDGEEDETDGEDEFSDAEFKELGFDRFIIRDEDMKFTSIFNINNTDKILFDELMINWKNNTNTIFKDRNTGEPIIIDIDLNSIDFPESIDKIYFYMNDKFDQDINPEGFKNNGTREDIVVFRIKSIEKYYYGYLLTWSDDYGFDNGNCGLNIDICESIDELKKYVLPLKLLEYCEEYLNDDN